MIEDEEREMWSVCRVRLFARSGVLVGDSLGGWLGQDLWGAGHMRVVSTAEERFAVLYAAYYRAIYAYVYRRLAPRVDDVSDAVAEVFSVAWRRIDDVPSGEQELMWLYGVARRCVSRSRRGHWRRLRLLARLSDEARGQLRSREIPTTANRVRDAIERLRPLDREVLRLVMWDGLSHREAAAVLGCSTNAVAQRLHTARERLRAELQGTIGNEHEMTERAQSA